MAPYNVPINRDFLISLVLLICSNFVGMLSTYSLDFTESKLVNNCIWL